MNLCGYNAYLTREDALSIEAKISCHCLKGTGGDGGIGGGTEGKKKEYINYIMVHLCNEIAM